MKKDLIVSLVCLAGTVALYISLRWVGDPKAIVFPRIVIVIMAILSGLLLLQNIMTRRVNSQTRERYPFVRVILTFFVIVIYFAVMEWLGFYLSSFLFFVTVSFVLGSRELNPAKGLARIGIAAIFMAFLFLLFNKLLEVQTPRGLFF